MLAVDCIVVTLTPKTPRRLMDKSSTVASAAANLVPGRPSTSELACTLSTPVVNTFATDAESTEFALLYGGGAMPDTVGSGPLVTTTGGPSSGVSVNETDSPKAELAPEITVASAAGVPASRVPRERAADSNPALMTFIRCAIFAFP